MAIYIYIARESTWIYSQLHYLHGFWSRLTAGSLDDCCAGKRAIADIWVATVVKKSTRIALWHTVGLCSRHHWQHDLLVPDAQSQRLFRSVDLWVHDVLCVQEAVAGGRRGGEQCHRHQKQYRSLRHCLYNDDLCVGMCLLLGICINVSSTVYL